MRHAKLAQASRCYFLLHVNDSLTIDRKAREHYNGLAAQYEMKDISIAQLWCGIKFTLLPDTILMHQTADVRSRADSHVDQGGTLYDLDDGRSSRCMPVATTRSVAATAAPATLTRAPSWLERTRLFSGVPLGLDFNNREGSRVMATAAQARGRSAKDAPAPLHYNQATRSPDWPL